MEQTKDAERYNNEQLKYTSNLFTPSVSPTCKRKRVLRA